MTSRFFDKVLEGKTPTADEWRDHLVEAHKKAPSMSPAAFSDCRNADGNNSYEWLAEGVSATSPLRTVVDLACGDGFLIPILRKRVAATTELIGIDMSEAELAVARKRASGDRVTFRTATADATGLEDASVDAVFCHMAFMLMLPLAPVVREMLRVLRPGGLFTALVGDRSQKTGLYSKIQDTLATLLREEFPKMVNPPTGDARVGSEAGIGEILADFRQVTIAEEQFVVPLDPGGVWEHLKNMYLIAALPAPVQAALKGRILDLCTTELRNSGSLLFDFPTRKFLAVR